MQVQAEFAQLEQEIHRLKVEYDRFFNGAVPIPPETERNHIQKKIRRLRQQRMTTLAEQFRFESLEARFNTLSEMFNRRVRELEQASSRPQPGVLAAAHGPDARSGVVLENVGDRRAVEALYRELYGSTGRSKKIDFATFEKYLGQQLDRVRTKTGCAQVKFRVDTRGRQPKLKAKPVRPQ